MNYNILLPIITVLLFACNTPKKLSIKNELQLIEAKYNNWTSGVKGKGKGSDFFIEVIVNTNDIKIDSLSINNKKLKTITKTNKDNQYNSMNEGLYNQGDTLLIRASSKNHFKLNESSHLYYFINGEEKILPIKTLTKIKVINHQ